MPQLAETAQLPQSIRPRDMSTIGCGCTCAVVSVLVDRRHLAGAVAAVVAEPVDVDAVVGRIGRDLEVDRLADIAADLGREALDVDVAVAVDAPFAYRDCPASCSPGRSCSATAWAG